MNSWQSTAADKRAALANLIPTQWRLAPSILEDLPLNLTSIPVQCEILTNLDLEITDIDDIRELANRIAAGRYSAVQVTEAFCKRAAIAQQLVNCLAEICFVQAIERAQYLDHYYQTNDGKTIGPLHGIPISLKDQFNIQGIETAMAYIGYLGKKEEYNSIVVDYLLSMGAVLYVKTTLPQTVMSPDTRSNLLGFTRNPLNRAMNPGGSSGGEGSLIAMKGSICGIGTDIGGSIRFPAASNGIYALKPSDGRLPYGRAKNSFQGQESIASVIGPMARSLSTLAYFMQSIIGSEPWQVDPKVHPIPWRNHIFEETMKTSLCFGILKADRYQHLSPPVQRAMDMSISALQKNGHHVIEWEAIDYDKAEEMAEKLYKIDGGKDVQQALALSGEPLIECVLVGSEETEMSVFENWQLNIARNHFAIRFLERWNKTREITGTGRPMDGILSPIHSLPAYPDYSPVTSIYTCIANLLQLSTVIIPITKVDPKLDEITDEYRNLQPATEIDQKIKDMYVNPGIFENCSVGLQIMCRRLEEEKAIGMGVVLENALKSFQ